MKNQEKNSTDEKFKKDLLLKVTLSWTLYFVLACGVFYFSSRQIGEVRLILFQEYHKSVIGLAAIFFAFSPTFYALIYSSESIRISMIRSGLKKYFDEYFKLSSMFSAILVILSVIGLIVSYAKFTDTMWDVVRIIIFSLSVSAMVCSFYWSFNYGKIAFNMIKYYTREI